MTKQSNQSDYFGALRLAITFCFLFAVPVRAATPETYQELLKKAEAATAKGDRKKADFYLTRYIGLAAQHPSDGRGMAELAPFLKKRALPPKAFISGDWDPEFLDWFESSVQKRWGVEETRVREKARSFEVSSTKFEDRYFATVVAIPQLELWHVLQDGLSTRPMVLPMGSASERPILFFGKVVKDAPSFQFTPAFLDLQRRSLHYIWKPEFYDLDKDGQPEVWIRYNVGWGNGFSQVLEVYRIRDDRELELLHRFRTGKEGIARRLEDGKVETGTALGRPGTAMDHDRYQFDTWDFINGSFKKTSNDERPFFLKTKDWKPYFTG